MKKKNRRSYRKIKCLEFQIKKMIMGVNAAGISLKLPSLNHVLNPSIFFLEETKLKHYGTLKL